MSLDTLRCSRCDGELLHDAKLNIFICSYCGTKFTQTTTDTGRQELDRRVKSGDTLIEMGDYETAERIFTKISEEFSYDYRGWWGLIKIITKNFSKILTFKELCEIKNLYQRITFVADASERALVDDIYQPYIQKIEGQINSQRTALEKQFSKLQNNFKDQKQDLEEEISRLEAKKNQKNRTPFWISFLIFAGAVILSFKISYSEGLNLFLFSLFIWLFVAYALKLIISSFFEDAKAKKVTKLNEKIAQKQKELHDCIEDYNAKSNAIYLQLTELGHVT